MFWKSQQKEPEKNSQPPAAPPPPAQPTPQPEKPPGTLKDQVVREAEYCRQKLNELLKVDFSFNPVCMMQIDSLIDDLLKGQPAQEPDKLVLIFGSYYGECLRRNYGGQWKIDEQGVRFLHGMGAGDVHAYPYSTIRDSIVGREPMKVFATAKVITKMVFDSVEKAVYPQHASPPAKTS